MKADYTKTEQWWDVTTEGDCEGKTVTWLGKWFGHLDEIAFSLAPKTYYKLCFRALGDATPTCETCGAPLARRALFPAINSRLSVSVQLDIDSGTWDLSAEDRRDVVASLLHDRPVSVGIGQYYATICLQKPTPPPRGEGE